MRRRWWNKNKNPIRCFSCLHVTAGALCHFCWIFSLAQYFLCCANKHSLFRHLCDIEARNIIIELRQGGVCVVAVCDVNDPHEQMHHKREKKKKTHHIMFVDHRTYCVSPRNASKKFKSMFFLLLSFD